MLHRTSLRAAFAATAYAGAAMAYAAPLSVNFDNFTYSGTVSRYATLADAQSRTNPTDGPFTIQTAVNGSQSTLPNARDGQFAVNSSAPAAYGADLTYISTAWYFTTTTNGNGWGNPNNTNDGFLQYYLTSTPTVTGGWQPGYTQFQLTIAGGNGDDSNAARLWPAPDSGAANISSGTFVDFNVNVTASFASPATLNSTTNWYETSAMPTSVSGTISGIFQNDQTVNTAYNGFYRFDYTVSGPGSWAATNSAVWRDGGTTDYPPASLWAAPPATAPAPVPTLSHLALLGLGLTLAATAAARRRRTGAHRP